MVLAFCVPRSIRRRSIPSQPQPRDNITTGHPSGYAVTFQPSLLPKAVGPVVSQAGERRCGRDELA